MVTAIVRINQRTNRVLNMIKAKHELKTKSEAIDKIAELYEDLAEDPPLRPEFVRKMLRRQKEPAIYVGSVEDFERRFLSGARQGTPRKGARKDVLAKPGAARGDSKKDSADSRAT